MKIKYKGWGELFTLWSQGNADIVPCRSRWPYRVEDDILIHDEKSKQPFAVGIPATTTKPRLFYYMVSNWRERLVDREKLESCGGVPIMPFELAGALEQMDRGDLAPLCAFDMDDSDPQALLFIQQWVSLKGKVGDTYLDWRKYGISSGDRVLEVTRRQRNQKVKTTRVAEWDEAGVNLRLLSQAYRSPSLNWAKDAVYVAASRALGLGGTLVLQRMGDVAMAGKKLPANGSIIPIKSTPAFLIRASDGSGS